MSYEHAAQQAPTTTVGALPGASPSIAALAAGTSELEAAIRVAQRMLAAYGDSSGFDIGRYAQAHGALAESLRILLRALDAEVVRVNLTPATDVGERCPAAHPDDPTGCNGPATVTVLDRHNTGARGCEHHGARMLASLDGGRVHALPDAPAGAAIRTFKAAAALRPFPWIEREASR
ncbi:hypothetical protein ACGFZG_24865 [Streptomyces antibioticus]|uniref:hypothetical protein n=1 Tax=Streptomyces antibioticus TaxID=1890 RepID=UPI0037174ADB